MNKIILTVSIAAYNVETCLKKCIDSFIKCKNFSRIQILIENDGSKDKTKDIAEEYQKIYPNNIEVVNKNNGGHGSTINESIRRACGEYFKVVDADDWVESNYLDQLVDYLEVHKVDLVLNPYYEINALTEGKKLVFPWKDKIDVGMIQHIRDIDTNQFMLAMHAMTISTSLLKKMTPCIDENCFYVDVEYVLFPMKYIETIVCLKFPIYNYLLGTQSQSMNMCNLINRRNQHMRVCKRIIEFYKENQDILYESTKNLVKTRVCSMICMQYVILLKVGKKQEKEEIIKFDNYLKNSSQELYVGALEYGVSHNYGYIKIVRKLREKKYKNFIFYYILLRIQKYGNLFNERFKKMLHNIKIISNHGKIESRGCSSKD